MAVLIVLFGCAAVVVLTAHTMQFGVCAACVLAVHLWICSEFWKLLLSDYFYLAGETCPFYNFSMMNLFSALH